MPVGAALPVNADEQRVTARRDGTGLQDQIDKRNWR